MSHRVDVGRKRVRDEFITMLAFVGNDCGSLKDKTQEMLSLARGLVGDRFPGGEVILGDVAACLEALQRARSSLEDAISFAHGIDISVEVPPSDGDWHG